LGEQKQIGSGSDTNENPMTAPVPVTLAVNERMALRRFASERGVSLEEAAAIVIREYLIAGGWLEWDEIDEATETAGSA
jgi:hypothetical protein